jgi:hypothetical protein
MQILATHRALFGRGHGAGVGARTLSEVDIIRVVDVLQDNQASGGWALIGAHPLSLVTEPRATNDFDFVIEDDRLSGVLHDLAAAFGDLDPVVSDVGLRMRALEIDLIRASNHALLQVALERQNVIDGWRVPRTEVLIALRFLSSRSVWRPRYKRMQDMADIAAIWESRGPDLDRAMLLELGGLVYAGAGRELDQVLDQLARGEPVSI